MEENWLLIEFPEIYDGWIIKYNPDTREIKWRNHHSAERLTIEERSLYEDMVKRSFKKKKV